jgi:asparagine synthase (glutamine-hydrolysing)
MCGITGICLPGESIEPDWIARMTEAIRHRGPDDEGYLLFNSKTGAYDQRGGSDTSPDLRHRSLSEGAVGQYDSVFGFRRLSILDLSPAGHQPMSYANGDLWIIFNGEIYNYIELRDELQAKGYVFSTRTDTEVILASYMEWGDACFEKFNGMWAFVIYDRRKKILLGSRDRFGVKPLYYTIRDGFFAFASEIKALLACPVVDRRVNEKVLFNFLLLDFVEQGEETFFEDIRKVPHSHYFIYDIDQQSLRFERYYQLPYSDDAGIFMGERVAGYSSEIKELLFEAVRLRLRSDALVGSCLSGGIDSSTIVSIVNEMLRGESLSNIGDRQKVFTACYPGESIDESYYAGKVVERTETDWYQVKPEADELWGDLRDLVHCQEEPFSSTSIYAQYRVMKLAHDAGVKVVLDGQGGDELFTGYLGYHGVFFSSLFTEYRFGTLAKEIYSLKNTPVTAKEAMLESMKSLSLRIMPLSLLSSTVLRLKSQIIPLLNRDFFEAHRGDIAEQYRERWRSANLNQYMAHLMADFGLQELLKYEDRNSMRFSIEARTPFADDVNLINYVFDIPWIYKIHSGWSKYLLRESAEELLPTEIARRKDKIGFATPQQKWLSELSERFMELLGPNDDYINKDTLRRRLGGKQLNAASGDIWRFMSVILWKSVFNI